MKNKIKFLIPLLINIFSFSLVSAPSKEMINIHAAEINSDNAYHVVATAAWMTASPVNPYTLEFRLFNENGEEYTFNKNIYSGGEITHTYNASTSEKNATVLCDLSLDMIPSRFIYKLTEGNKSISKEMYFRFHIYYLGNSVYDYQSSGKPNKDKDSYIYIDRGYYRYNFDYSNLDNKEGLPTRFMHLENTKLPNLFGNTFNDKDSTHTFKDHIDIPEAYKGSEFSGIYDENGEIAYYDSLLKPNDTLSKNALDQELTLKPFFQYKLTLDLNSGDFDSTNKNATHYLVDKVTTLPFPKKLGYSFTGWHLSQDLLDSPIFEIDGFINRNDIHLYASYDKNSYQLFLDPNGGEIDKNVINLSIDNIDIPTPNKSGYEFISWKYNDVIVDENNIIDVIDNSETRNNITLIASYKIVHYDITYELNGGLLLIPNKSSYTIEDEFTLYSPIRLGYSFIGWYNQDDIPVEKIVEGTTGNISLEARYTKEPLTIHFDTDGGSYVDSAHISFNDLVPMPSDPIKEDDELYRYTFIGWFKDIEDEEPFDFENEVAEHSFTLYAKYSLTDIKIAHVEDFIDLYMHTEIEQDDSGTGKCISEGYYRLAKQHYNLLSEEEKDIFVNDEEYRAYLDRFTNWMIANNDSFDSDTLNIVTRDTEYLTTNSGSLIIIITISIVVTSLATLTIAKKQY